MTNAAVRNTIEPVLTEKDIDDALYQRKLRSLCPAPQTRRGENKMAWFVGSGLASLAGAAFLIPDGHMAGDRIAILEELAIPGGALDGIKEPDKGFVIRGGREMEDHFECLWDLFRSIPSLEIEGASVLDEFFWLNKSDPNFSLQRSRNGLRHVRAMVAAAKHSEPIVTDAISA